MKKLLNKLLVKFILSLLLLSSYGQATEPVYIDHMVGLYVHENSLNFLEHNLDQLLEINGYSSTDYYIQSIGKKMDVTPFNDLFPDNKKVQQVGAQVRSYFKQFLKGLTIKNRHEFEFSAKGIEVTAEWDKIGVKIAKSNIENFDRSEKLKVEAHLFARRLRLYVDEFRAEDHQHKFLGKIGANGFYLELDTTKGQPLNIIIPATIELLENGGLKVEVQQPVHNLSQIALSSGWNPPLLLPRVEIRINGRRAWLNLNEVEKLIKGQVPKLMSGLQEMGQKFVDEELAPLLNEKVNKFVGKGFTEVNEMEPVGIPDGMIDTKYIWGLGLQKLDFVGRNLHVGLKGFVQDPKVKNYLALDRSLVASDAPLLKTLEGEDYHLALSLNEGFINRILQFSNKRGYFKKIATNSGENLNLVEMPVLKMKGRGTPQKSGAALTINTKYTVTGWQKIFVRNPIEIKMDLNVNFTQDAQGRTQMIVDGIDLPSVNLPNRFIRILKKKVKKEVRKKLQGINKGIKNLVLSEELPIPSNVGGISIKASKTKIDPNGHLIIFLKTNL